VEQQEWLARQFEEQRPHLRAVAYRMLGSLSEADDAVQDAWLRLSRADTSEVENPRAWLTTIVARVALNMLRARRTRREQPLDVHVPDPIIDPTDGTDPEHEALLADSVGLALLVVLETLTPAERLAFVLHDMFAIPFDEIAPIVDRSPEATRQLASRARRLRADGGRLSGLSQHVQGAENVAGQALLWSRVDLTMRRALINGAPGIVTFLHGRPFSIGALTVKSGKIVEIDFLADPERIARLDLNLLDD
jgi:RNA polymerase sigma factor (sigma-70 family)